ncbi:MAG: hypothetical protein IKF07_03785 [Eubacterium sp.]|nr:hypothetical protein [Eubacterium sp.]
MSRSNDKITNKILAPVLVIAATMFVCILLLTAVNMIPTGQIEQYSRESADHLIKSPLFVPLIGKRVSSIQDNYADAELLAITYSIDNSRPFVSAVRDEYAVDDEKSAVQSYRDLVNGKTEPNSTYSRYWHGSMVYIRPLLMFMSIDGIRKAIGSLIILLQLLVVIMLLKMGKKTWLICYILAFIATAPWMLFTCLEYSSVFLVLPGAVLVILYLISKGEEDKAALLFGAAGVITCFVDFLTTETLTFTIPMLFLLLYLIEEKKLSSVSSGIKVVVINGIWWAAGYITSFLTKFVLIYIVCGREELIESFKAGMLRVSGQVHMGNTNLAPEATDLDRLAGAIWHNLSPFFFVKYDHMTMVGAVFPALLIISVAFVIVFLFHKDINIEHIIPVMILAVLPYIRFLVLSNHAYMHFFFTYRAEMVTVMVLLYLTWMYGIRNIPEMIGKNSDNDKGKRKKGRKVS